MEDKTLITKPDITINLQLSEIGYQADIYVDGKLRHQQCRDFSGFTEYRQLKRVVTLRIIDNLPKVLSQ